MNAPEPGTLCAEPAANGRLSATHRRLTARAVTGLVPAGIFTFALALALAAAAEPADVWHELARYTLGSTNEAPARLEKLIRETPVARHGELETRLIDLLRTPDATADGKRQACRALRQLGTEACVPAVAPLLTDTNLSHIARYALQGLPGDAVDDALRAALPQAADSLKPGLIGSLAERGDADAIPLLLAYVTNASPAVSSAAVAALGKIGGPAAATALATRGKPPERQPALRRATLDCAEGFAARGNATKATELYESVYFSRAPDAWRLAALRGLLRTDPEKSIKRIVDLLRGEDQPMRTGALRLLVTEPGTPLTLAVARVLGSLQSDRQAELVAVLAERGDPLALQVVTGCLVNTDPDVRAAGIAAVGKLGNADSVGELLEQSRRGDVTETVIAALARMTGQGIDDALIEALGDPSTGGCALDALVARGCTNAAPRILAMTTNAPPELRPAAWKALAELAGPRQAPAMMTALLGVKDASERKAAEAAMKRLCASAIDRDTCFAAIAASYEAAEDTTKALIVDLAATTGGGRALDLARRALASQEPALHERALRALAGWPEASAAPLLLEVARTAATADERLIALRGYIHVTGVDARRPADKEKVAMYQTAAALAERAEEKRLIVSGLRKVKDIAALKALAVFFDDSNVRPEAELAAVDLANDLKKRKPADVVPFMKQVAESDGADPRLAARAKRITEECERK